MPDNLTVSVGIDFKKLEADRNLLKAKLAQMQREANSEIAKVSRGADPARLKELSAGIADARQQYAGMNKVLTEHYRVLGGATRAAKEFGKAHKEIGTISAGTTREVLKLSREIGNLEVNTGMLSKTFREFPKVAIPIAVVGAAATVAAKAINETTKAFVEFDRLSKGTGFAKNDLLALDRIFRGANAEAGTLEAMVRKIGEDFDKAKTKGADLGAAIGGVTVFRGGTRGTADTGGVSVIRGPSAGATSIEGGGKVVVLRGDRPSGIDPSKGFAGLVDQTQFRTAGEFMQEATRVLVNLDKTFPALAREIVRSQYPGRDVEEVLATAREQVRPGAMDAARKKAADDALMNEQYAEWSKLYEISTKETAAKVEEARNKNVAPLIPSATAAVQATGEAVETVGDRTAKLTNAIVRDWDKAGTALEIAPEPKGAVTFQDEWTGAIDAITKAWSSAVEFMSSSKPLMLIPGEATKPQGGGMATGGVVPGFGTGDTVPAMLTPGEFVARQSSVQYYGANLFRALNAQRIPRSAMRFGYALGGLVDPSQHFAAGGLVSGGGSGTPVHLHLNGKEFVTSASSAIAESLVREARSQSMRSAGIKPSWVS